MKKIILFAAICLANLDLEAQCTTQFSKITKFEQGQKKDKYGNVTDNEFLKVSLATGEKIDIIGFDLSDHEKLLYIGINASKNLLYVITERSRQKFNVQAIQFFYYPKSKTSSSFYVRWDPSISLTYDQSYDACCEESGALSVNFLVEKGWAFSRIEGDNLVMTKSGVEYKFTHAKTQEKDCKIYIKRL